MIRLVLFFFAVAAIAYGLSWLADHPGQIFVDWEGHEVDISVFNAVIVLTALSALLILFWSMVRQLVASPRAVTGFLRRRQQRRGLDALSTGIIAVGAGDPALATRYAGEARRSLPNEPLTDLLRAQAAQLTGDHKTARRVYESMLAAPDTEMLGLRGLFLEAMRDKELAAARQFSERAVKINPKIDWPVNALFDLQCRDGDWQDALETLAVARKNGHIEKDLGRRRRAVLLTAQAQEREEDEMDAALSLALEAHKLAPDLVPAGEIAGRALASKGNTSKAASIIAKVWKRAPHPDLAAAYAYARPGDSPKDRLKRVKALAGMTPHNIEAPIAVASAAIEARDWDAARLALQPLLEKRQTQRVCTLMARIEGGQYGDRGRVREWLARAVHAPRDPAWTADGTVSDHWAPISPVTGELDAFEWKLPVEPLEKPDAGVLLDQLMPMAIVADAAAIASTSEVRPQDDGGSVEIAAPSATIESAPATIDPEFDEAILIATKEISGQGRTEDRVAATEPDIEGDPDPVDAGRGAGAGIAAGRGGAVAVPPPSVPSRGPRQPSVAALQPAPSAEPGRDAETFVPPHAPDDPGPEDMDPDEARTPLARYRMSPAKNQA